MSERERDRETDGKRNGEKKLKEKFIDNQQVGWREWERESARARASRERDRRFIDNQQVTEGRSASTIPPLSVWPCGTPLRTQGGSNLHLSDPIT